MFGPRVDEFIISIVLDRLHEAVCYGDRDVEVVESRIVVLGSDEVKDIRMINAENAHVRTSPGASLLYCLGAVSNTVMNDTGLMIRLLWSRRYRHPA